MRIGDLDGDTDLDLVVSVEPPRTDQGWYNRLAVLVNEGDSVFRAAGEIEIPTTLRFFLGDVSPGVGLDLIVAAWEPSRLFFRRQEASQSGADCDGNGIPDACDMAAGRLHDDDANGVADEFERVFHRGESAPPVPGVPGFPCGRDTQRARAPGHLGCVEYPACR